MKFSIITCTLNSRATIADTIESVIHQNYPNKEHLFVDGGSTDGTLDVIRDYYPDARIVYGVTGGISRAMNEGIKASDGEILLHLHSDDVLWDGNVLTTVNKAFKDSEALWLTGEYDYIDPAGENQHAESVGRVTLRRLLLGNCICHQATYIRRDAFEQVGAFDQNLKYCMDYDLWLRLMQISEPICLNKKLVYFRAHPGSISTSNRRAVLKEELRVRSRYYGTHPATWLRYLVRYAKRWRWNALLR